MLTGGQLQGTLQALLGCVAGELDPAPCVQYVSVGPPALDNCCDTGACDGQLTVHLLSLVPISDQLQRRSPSVAPCRPGPVGADVRVVLGRCHPSLDNQGGPPDPAALDAAAAQLADDAAAVRRALQCCGFDVAIASVDVQQPPSGGCSLLVASVVVDPSTFPLPPPRPTPTCVNLLPGPTDGDPAWPDPVAGWHVDPPATLERITLADTTGLPDGVTSAWRITTTSNAYYLRLYADLGLAPGDQTTLSQYVRINVDTTSSTPASLLRVGSDRTSQWGDAPVDPLQDFKGVWRRFTQTYTVPPGETAGYWLLGAFANGSADSDRLDVTAVQVERGATATDYCRPVT